MSKYIGYKVGQEDLYVGDILAFQSGYGGFYKVEERLGEYWVTDVSSSIYGEKLNDEDIIKDFKLTHNLDYPWSKRDRKNPLKEPLHEVYCDGCGEVVGGFDVDTGEFTWFENCSYHREYKKDGYAGIMVDALCSRCTP
jgi:hypothetical protein